MAARQLLLISSDDQGWKLDDRTKAVGRAGVARVDVSVPMEPVTSRERRPIEGATPRATGDPTGAESPRDDGEGGEGTAGAEAPSGPTDTASEGPDTTRRQ